MADAPLTPSDGPADPTTTKAVAGVTDPTVTAPVEVPDSAVMKILTTVLRYLLTAGGGWLAQRGYVSDSAVEQVVGALMVVLPTALGSWLTRHANEQLKLLEAYLPDSIAKRV